MLASACVWGEWAASPRLARTADSQMEPHGLPRSHGACLIVSVDSGQTPEASSVHGFTHVHSAAFPERQVWSQRGTRSLALQNRPSLPPAWLLGDWPIGGDRGAFHPPCTFRYHPGRCCVNSLGTPGWCGTSGSFLGSEAAWGGWGRRDYPGLVTSASEGAWGSPLPTQVSAQGLAGVRRPRRPLAPLGVPHPWGDPSPYRGYP